MSTEDTRPVNEPGIQITTRAAKPHELARLTSVEIADLPKEHTVVVQPIGSTEQHGPHLPVMTDAYIAERLARGSVSLLGDDGPDVWILPTLSYGRSMEHAGFVGTITLSTDTLLDVCREIGRSVAASGFRRLVFLNGHGGNVALLDVAIRDIRTETGLMVFRIMPSHFGVPEGVECPDAEFAAHADFVETSVMLALDETMVHLDRAQAGGEAAVRLFSKRGTDDLAAPLPTAWLTRDVSRNGVIGDPRRATAAIGKRIVDAWQHRLAECYRQIAAFEFLVPE